VQASFMGSEEKGFADQLSERGLTKPTL
jgi:hypothetical protein